MSAVESDAPYWSQDARELLAALGSGSGGLSSEGAAKTLAAVGPNSVDEASRLSALRLLLRQFESPLVLILVFAAAVSMLLYEWVDAAIILAIASAAGLPRDWGSGCGGDFGGARRWRRETLPEAGAERAVVDGAADLEQPISTAPDQRICCDLFMRRLTRKLACPRSTPCQPAAQPGAVRRSRPAGRLPDEVAVQRLQRGPQLARGRDG